MLFAMFHAFERLDADVLPPPHRLVLIVLADLADAHARARLDAATLATVAKRTGLGARQVKRLLDELSAAVWIEREARPKASAPPVYFVRCEGGPIVARRLEAEVPVVEVAPPAPPAPVVAHRTVARSTAPRTMAELMAKRPADDLLTVLNRGAENDHPFCKDTVQRVLVRGWLTENEKKRLREIRDESATGRGSARRRGSGTSTLQTGTWKPKGAPP